MLRETHHLEVMGEEQRTQTKRKKGRERGSATVLPPSRVELQAGPLHTVPAAGPVRSPPPTASGRGGSEARTGTGAPRDYGGREKAALRGE